MTETRHRISPPRLKAMSEALDDQGRISLAQLADIFGESDGLPADEQRAEFSDEEQEAYRQLAAMLDELEDETPQRQTHGFADDQERDVYLEYAAMFGGELDHEVVALTEAA